LALFDRTPDPGRKLLDRDSSDLVFKRVAGLVRHAHLSGLEAILADRRLHFINALGRFDEEQYRLIPFEKRRIRFGNKEIGSILPLEKRYTAAWRISMRTAEAPSVAPLRQMSRP
jgi:hypothetical protein